jgi:hypothetical protein
MDHDSRKNLVERYLAAYNRFDIDGMLALLTPDVRFENVAGGTVNAQADGIDAFRALAEQGKAMFTRARATARAPALPGAAALRWTSRAARPPAPSWPCRDARNSCSATGASRCCATSPDRV